MQKACVHGGNMKKTISIVIAGAGGRGFLAYAPYTKKYPEKMKLVGVAEPDDFRRARIREEYGLAEEQCFSDAKQLFAVPSTKKYPEKMKLVGVAEPDDFRRARIREEYGLAEEQCFSDAKQLFAVPRMADIAFICTQDRQHVEHALLAMRQGYDILLEKPVSPYADECRRLYQARRTDSMWSMHCLQCGRGMIFCWKSLSPPMRMSAGGSTRQHAAAALL